MTISYDRHSIKNDDHVCIPPSLTDSARPDQILQKWDLRCSH